MSRWDEIRTRCPELFKNYVTFECGEGWADLILGLSLKIEEILSRNRHNNEMFVLQIKEKYGTLRFYMSCETDEIIDLISDAEALSSQTCEDCGAPAKMRGMRWLEVKCDVCFSGGK